MPTSPHTLARHCAPLHSEPFAPPTVASIREGERRLHARPYIAMGLDQQGRRPDRIPQPAADSAEGAAGDDSDYIEPWARVFGWLAVAITAGWVCFLVYVARSAG